MFYSSIGVSEHFRWAGLGYNGRDRINTLRSFMISLVATLNGSKLLDGIGENEADFGRCFLFSGFPLGKRWDR